MLWKFDRLLLPCMAVVLVGSGCTVGISGPGRTTTLGYDLSLLSERPDSGPARTPPFHLVVAQAGAAAPEAAMLAELRRHPRLFREVSVLPAAVELRNFAREVEQKSLEDLAATAEMLGGDILFLAGGKLDIENSRTAASILDLTIVGHYVLPTNRIGAKGAVIGAAVDLRSRRLMFTVDESVAAKGRAPSVSRHSAAEAMAAEVRDSVLSLLAARFARTVADQCGLAIEPSTPAKRFSARTRPSDPVATVYIMSDGFHYSLVLPQDVSGAKSRYVEIGIGERNWVLGRGWKWLDAAMAVLAHNDGIAVVEYSDGEEMAATARAKKHVWRVALTADEWGGLLSPLENDLALQDVLSDGAGRKIVKTESGYHLFYNCNQFAMTPLDATNRSFKSLTELHPTIDGRHDAIFETSQRIAR